MWAKTSFINTSAVHRPGLGRKLNQSPQFVYFAGNNFLLSKEQGSIPRTRSISKCQEFGAYIRNVDALITLLAEFVKAKAIKAVCFRIESVIAMYGVDRNPNWSSRSET
jgi:hypothetical protein